MSFSVIIPARYGSTRLEGKPLLDIVGRPMIQHVYERAILSGAEQVIIATEDQRIYEVAKAFGAHVCMTRSDHESGTDRLQEVASQLQLPDDHIVVNVQGDEPLIPASVIDQVASNLAATPQAAIATLIEPINDTTTVFDPNAVKVVINQQGQALYFSRSPIPWDRHRWQPTGTGTVFSPSTQQGQALLGAQPLVAPYYRHIGIYAYRVGFLHEFMTWPVGVLENLEKLEQLRALEHGRLIYASEAVEAIPPGIDTQEDLENVRRLLAKC